MIAVKNETLVLAGLSFKTSELSSRSRFAFNAEACRDAYANTSSDLPFFILSTCNRTEVYAWSSEVSSVAEILRSQAQCSEGELERIMYAKSGEEAIEHFFRVAAGLDSQIIGDYDIISQIKTAFRGAKESRRTNGLLEKLYNFALKASKEVKNSTSFSDGTLSVPYAVVKHLGGLADIKSVTVVGAGDTGELMIRYLRSYLPSIDIRLVNRDEEKLHSIGSLYDVMQFPIAALKQSLTGTDAVIVTTNAASPIVDKDHIGNNIRFVFDLSVPRNVSSRVYNMPNVTVLDTDRISETIKTNIPKVEEIVRAASVDFANWMKRRNSFTTSDRK
jgi:glutamyl-tRNA reductase